MTGSALSKNKFEYSCSDSGFLEFSASSIMISSQEQPCVSSLRNMCIESKDDNINNRVEPEVEVNNFKWSEVQNMDMSLLQQSPELCYLQDVHGDTLLHKAIGYGNLESCFWLICLAPVSDLLDIQNDKSFTALHEAVACQEPMVARRLLLSGANPITRTFSGNTALHIACLHGSFECARALIEPLSSLEMSWGAKNSMVPQNLEITNFQGRTCLHLAASNGYLDIVILLVNSGADVDASEGMGGRTAIHLAIQNRHRDVVIFLARERPACMTKLTWSGNSVYQLALESDPALAEELLRLGANPALGRFDSGSDSEYTTDDGSMSDSSDN